MSQSVDLAWTAPDAVVAAVLAACLAAAVALLVARRSGPGHRHPLAGPGMTASTVVALAVALVTQGEPIARAAAVVAGVLIVLGVVAWRVVSVRVGPPPGSDRIAPPDGRC